MENLQQQLSDMRQRTETFQAEVLNLRQENVQLRTLRDDPWAAVQNLPNFIATIQEQTRLLTSLESKSPVDSKGLGKPEVFKNMEKDCGLGTGSRDVHHECLSLIGARGGLGSIEHNIAYSWPTRFRVRTRWTQRRAEHR